MASSFEFALRVFPQVQELAEAAAELLFLQTEKAIQKQGKAYVALSGGSTPLALFEQLRRPEWQNCLDWKNIRFFWVDERCVAPEHSESNFGAARRMLLEHVPAVCFPMSGEEEPAQAAVAYEAVVRREVPANGEGIPRFDCIFLGMGEDGHTASLFPGAPEPAPGRLIAPTLAAHLAPRPESRRISMTLPLLNAAQLCVVLAAGKGKHPRLCDALNLLAEPVFPIQRVQPVQGQLVWMLDQAAFTGKSC